MAHIAVCISLTAAPSNKEADCAECVTPRVLKESQRIHALNLVKREKTHYVMERITSGLIRRRGEEPRAA